MSTLIIESIHLYKNRRFLNKGTHEIIYTPNAPLQLILGSNGFGKSSLLGEFSLLPAIKKDYQKGGYKRAKALYNGVRYETFSDFGKGGKHSFKKDGVELNEGGTFVIQKALVEEHLKYTFEIHNFLLGRVKFTRMSPAQRKEWMVKLSPNDVSFALRLYSELSTQARNIVGAHKHASKKIVEISNALVSTDVAALQKSTEELMETIQTIHNAKNNVEVTTADKTTIRIFNESIGTLRRVLLDQQLLVKEKYIPDLDDRIVDTQMAIAVTQQELKSKLKEHENYEVMLNNAVFSDNRSIEAIGAENVELINQLNALVFDPEFSEPASPVKGKATLLHIGPNFLSMIEGLKPNPNKSIYNKERKAATLAVNQRLTAEANKLDNYILLGHDKLAKMENAIQVKCDDCGNEWKLNVDLNEKARIEEYIKTANDDLVKIKAELKETVEYLEDCEQWEKQSAAVIALFVNNPEIDFMANYVMDSRFYTNPEECKYILPVCSAYIDARVLEHELRSKIDLNNEIVYRKKLTESSNVDVMRNRLETLELEIEQEQANHNKLTALLTNYKATKERYDKLRYTQRTTSDQLTKFIDAATLDLLATIDEELNKQLSNLYTQLANLNESISEIRGQEAILKHLIVSRTELQEDALVFDALIDNLSPSSGLIADILLGFINTITAQWNDMIRKLWTTPLYVMPCSMDKGDLDYRFPLQSTDPSNQPADVSEGSEGEQELIDFVFLMVGRHYMGYSGFPLFLDEVGRCYHEQHRSILYNYIKTLVEAGIVPQVLVISHFESTYKTLVHAEVNVIDPTGVLVTPGANKNLILK